jgi:hypothetical protein
MGDNYRIFSLKESSIKLALMPLGAGMVYKYILGKIYEYIKGTFGICRYAGL